MSWDEVYTRCRQEAARRRDVVRHRCGIEPKFDAGDNPGARGRFFFDAAQVADILKILRQRMPDTVDRIITDARCVLDHRFRLLGYHNLDFGKDVDWSLDPVNRRRAPFKPWPSIPYLDFTQVGDHKVIWELNRHQFLPVLAKAYRLTGEDRYIIALKELWFDWQRKNQYPLGVNWTSTLEVAFRTLSWIWVDWLLEESPAATDDFRQQLTRSIGHSGRYIRRFLSTYFSPNTHLLGEGVLLFVIGVLYPGLKSASEWQAEGLKIVQEACEKQVRADGFYFEQSTYYHVYALDLFLLVRVIAERNAIATPPLLDHTIRKMLSVLVQLSQAGALPRYGDDDGGRVFDPSRNHAEHMLDPLCVGAAFYRDSAFKPAVSEFSSESLWLLGPESAAVFDSLQPVAIEPSSCALTASGIYAMTSPGTRTSQLFIDAGEQGSLSSGHGHADALSIQLSRSGRLWLTDPGTCHYFGPDSRRERFRGTFAHNTLTVDGIHQAEPRGPFGWGPLPTVETVRWIEGKEFDYFEGCHSGYTRLAEPVIHRRSILRAGPNLWLVRDVADGNGMHDLDIRWHFAPDLVLQTRGPMVIACEESQSLAMLAAGSGVWTRHTGMEEYSPVYGSCIQAPTVRWTARAICPTELCTLLTFNSDLQDAGLKRLDDTGGASVYEYASGPGGFGHLFLFSSAAGAWNHREWASDASMCWLSSGENRMLILVDASYLDYAGQRVMEFPRRAACIECSKEHFEWRLCAKETPVIWNPDSLP